MKGTNEININQATMQDAIQLWLTDQFKHPPKVVSVAPNTAPNKNGFKIHITDEIAAPPETSE